MRRSFAVAVALVSAHAAAGAPRETFLHELKLESETKGEARWDDVQLVIDLGDEPAGRALFLQRRSLKAEGGSVTVRSLTAPVMKDAVLPRHRADSWVMDFKEPAFAALWTEVEKQFGPRPSVADLTAFTRAYISKKSLGRNFDLASKVVATREGDCSEHAVLLAAVLRKHGFPARVMLGTVLVNLDGTPSAFGHAWVETFGKGAWATADAALPAGLELRYLPSAELGEEGPGFMLALVPALQAMRFKRLLLRPR